MIPWRVRLCLCESVEQLADVSWHLLLMFILPEQAGMSLLVCWGAILGAMLSSNLTLLFLSHLHSTDVPPALFSYSVSQAFLPLACLCTFVLSLLDSSQEYTDSTGIDVHEFLVNTLKNNPRYEIATKDWLIDIAVITRAQQKMKQKTWD